MSLTMNISRPRTIFCSRTQSQAKALKPQTKFEHRRLKAAEQEASLQMHPQRRELLLSLGGVSVGMLLTSAPAHAEIACSDFKTAANGIQWCETKEGVGKTPNKGQLIRCHYTGRLSSNGRVFDSSYERRRPLTFKVERDGKLSTNRKGEGREGGKRRVVIPAELGYGSRGAGGVIPPNSSLTFDIELLGKR